MHTQRRLHNGRATTALVLFLAGQTLFYGSAFLPVVPWSWQGAGGIAPGVLAAGFSMVFSFFPTFLGVVLMVLAPALFWAHSASGVAWLRVLYLAFAINVWPFGITLPDLGAEWVYYPGYWTWCVSVTLVAPAFFIAPRGDGFADKQGTPFRLGLADTSAGVSNRYLD